MQARPRLALLLLRAHIAQMGIAYLSIGGMVNAYIVALTELIADVLNGDRDGTSMAREHRRLLNQYSLDAFLEGMIDAGAPDEKTARDSLTDADENRISEWIASQREHVSQFSKDVQAVASGELDRAAQQALFDRADSWGASLQNLGEQGRLSWLGDIFLTMAGDDGDESWPECQKYKGQRHRHSRWENPGVAASNGNPEYTCGRWDNCHHHFVDDEGNVIIA